MSKVFLFKQAGISRYARVAVADCLFRSLERLLAHSISVAAFADGSLPNRDAIRQVLPPTSRLES